jgi:hypothetical protein
LTIFGLKLGVFLKNNVMMIIYAKICCVLNKNRQFVANFFGESIFKILTSVPGQAAS